MSVPQMMKTAIETPKRKTMPALILTEDAEKGRLHGWETKEFWVMVVVGNDWGVVELEF